MDDTETLMEFGMSKSEAKIYLTLLKNGPLTSGKLVTLSKQHVSVTYYSLHRLLEKGFVNYRKRGRFYEYSVIDPEVFLEKLKFMGENLQTKIPTWKKLAKLAEEKISVEVFEGLKGLANLFNQILKNVKRGYDYRSFTLGEEFKDPEVVAFFHKLNLKRVKLGIRVRALSNKAYKNVIEKYYKFPNSEQDLKSINLRFSDFKFPQGVTIFKDNVILFSWLREPKAIHIKEARIAEQYAEFFDELYEKAEPYVQIS